MLWLHSYDSWLHICIRSVPFATLNCDFGSLRQRGIVAIKSVSDLRHVICFFLGTPVTSPDKIAVIL
jgi:hypothetical protein